MVLATTYYGFLNVSIDVLLYTKDNPLMHAKHSWANKALGKMEFISIALYKVL
jgi:hypothetical protein